MNLSRRNAIKLSIGTMAFHAIPSVAWAQMNNVVTIGYYIPPEDQFRDPCQLSWIPPANMMRMCLEPLVEIGGENRLNFIVAEQIVPDPTGKIWTIDLRPNIMWIGSSKSEPLTSRHVAANFQHWMDVEESSLGQQFREFVADTQVISDQRLQLTLKKPNYEFLYVLTAYSALLMHPDDGWSYSSKSRRTGPFKMVSYKAGEQAHFEPEPNYRNTNDRAVFTIRFVQDDGASDQVFDMVPQLDPDQADALIKRGMNIKKNSLPVALILHMDCTGPLADNQLRQALKACMDPQGILDSIYGYGRPADHTHASPIHLDYPKGLKFIPSYDPQKAKALWGNRTLEIPVHYPAGNVWQANAVKTYTRQAHACGIKLIPTPIEKIIFDRDWGKFPGMTATKWAARPLGRQLFDLVYKSTAQWNISRWENRQFDESVNKLPALPLSQEGRSAEIMTSSIKILHEEGPMIQLAWLDCNKAYDARRLSAESVVVRSTGLIEPNLLRPVNG